MRHLLFRHQDVIRILHREPAKVWGGEVIERPVLCRKTDKDAPAPRIIYQAKAPEAVIVDNHAGADLLAQIIIDKYRYHLPEYRQVKQYADLGVRLPASTLTTGYTPRLPDWSRSMRPWS